MRILTTASFLTLALIMSTANAATASGPKVEKLQAKLQERFKAADTNGDGKLSKAEAKGRMPLVYRHFDEIDAADQGVITPEQLDSFAAKAM